MYYRLAKSAYVFGSRSLLTK